MRNRLKLAKELDPNFSFQIARTQGELSDAYRILHDSYLEMGYGKPNISGMRIVKYFALPSTTTLVAMYDKKVVGTISIIRRSSFGLPMESAFNLSEFVEKNEVIAEVSSLAIDNKFRQKRGALFLPLLKFFWEYVERFMNLDSIVITVNPSMSDFYEAFLNFRKLNHAIVSDYSFANGNPGVGLYLNIKTAPEAFEKLYNNKSFEKNLYHYFVKRKLPHFVLPQRTFKKSSDPVMTPEMLNFFFVQKSSVFAELTLQEKMALGAAYPKAQYKKVIPNTHRQYIRHVVNIKAKVKGSSEAPITIFDVSSIGMCAASSSFNSFGKVTMEVAISEERVSVVIGEICWKDVDRNIVGIRLVEADSNWLDFIEYLGNDLVVLADESQKKAS
ncbi:MAG: hypothetical protein JNM24_19580 [Bdellovibrionaceae bacterium]|nr:hypothetical protein [Pseudobdellovibrionaceae bacterium]